MNKIEMRNMYLDAISNLNIPVTICAPSKKKIRTFGWKGASFQRGAKTISLRNFGYAKSN